MQKYKLIDLKAIKDKRGSLISLEANKNIPFDIKRIYYIYDTKDLPRGFHAHKSLQQVAIALNGSCVFVLDDGLNKKEIKLNSPNQGLLIQDLIWREMKDFSKDCVLMVVASDFYDEKDYIRDYEDFKRMTK